MRRYLVISGSSHAVLLAAWVFSGALLSKPRMSYYAIDLVSSLPAGGPSVSETAAPVAEAEVPKPLPVPVPVKERKLPAKEIIKVKSKLKKAEPPPKPQPKHKLNLKAALAVLDKQGKPPSRQAAAASGDGGSGIVAEAGPAFPFPWYLKAIADKLNQQWHPPQDFQEDTLCQVAFVIHRDGQISGAFVEKASGDSTFDQLAQRAVLYASPLPPLPGGFPDETLRVHMKFVGKPL